MGVKYVLDSEAADFEAELKKVMEEVKPGVFFDAVGGKVTETVFAAMPPKSFMWIFDALGFSEMKVDAARFLFEDKTIKGYDVFNVLEAASKEKRKEFFDFIWNDLKTNGGIFKVDIAKKYSLKDFKSAIETYPKVASKGKILLIPE